MLVRIFSDVAVALLESLKLGPLDIYLAMPSIRVGLCTTLGYLSLLVAFFKEVDSYHVGMNVLRRDSGVSPRDSNALSSES